MWNVIGKGIWEKCDWRGDWRLDLWWAIWEICDWRGDRRFDLRCEIWEICDWKDIWLEILFEMCNLRDMRLERCAKVIGEVMGNDWEMCDWRLAIWWEMWFDGRCGLIPPFEKRRLFTIFHWVHDPFKIWGSLLHFLIWRMNDPFQNNWSLIHLYV